jgi:hypothetical protein
MAPIGVPAVALAQMIPIKVRLRDCLHQFDGERRA